MSEIQLIIFAKAPVAGQVKTRLIPALGADGAARLAGQMLDRILRQAIISGAGNIELCVSPDANDPAWLTHRLPERVSLSNQGEGDLGRRMQRACERSISVGRAVILVGTDCPEMDSSTLQRAAASLDNHDAILIPATDGGYVLLGLNRFDPEIMQDIPWGTRDVTRITLQRLDALGFTVQVHHPLHDIDEPGDLIWLPSHYKL